MDYTQLTDDELRRKVQELMGYSVRYHSFGWDKNPATYNLYNGDILFFSAITEESAWSQAPDPLNDANMYMALVDEIKSGFFMTQIILHDYDDKACIIGEKRCGHDEVVPRIEVQSSSFGRAICEVYCQVKEGK